MSVKLSGHQGPERLLDALPARTDDLHMAPQGLELRRRGLHYRLYARIHHRVAQIGRPGDVEAFDIIVAGCEVRPRLARQREAVPVVAAGDRVQDERGITHRAREGPR